MGAVPMLQAPSFSVAFHSHGCVGIEVTKCRMVSPRLGIFRVTTGLISKYPQMAALSQELLGCN